MSEVNRIHILIVFINYNKTIIKLNNEIKCETNKRKNIHKEKKRK